MGAVATQVGLRRVAAFATAHLAAVTHVTSQRRGVAAFDFDGTLVQGDSFPRFLAALLGRRRFLVVVVRSSLPMVLEYLRGGRDASKAALISRALGGLSSSEVSAAAESFAGALVPRVRPEMLEALEWHQERLHRRVLVSASLDLYLTPFGALSGFDDVIATRLEVDADGRLTGRLDGRNVRAAEKAARLAHLLGSEQVEIWAYGDSAGDHHMLAMADHPSWVGRRRR